jgi:NADH dehydrogenase
MQTGIHAARTIKRRQEGKDAQPFRYRDLGSMAVVSRRRAIVSFRGLRISGYLGWLMWLVVHITFMTGFKNRFTTFVHWWLSFAGRSRTERALTAERIRAEHPAVSAGVAEPTPADAS